LHTYWFSNWSKSALASATAPPNNGATPSGSTLRYIIQQYHLILICFSPSNSSHKMQLLVIVPLISDLLNKYQFLLYLLHCSIVNPDGLASKLCQTMVLNLSSCFSWIFLSANNSFYFRFSVSSSVNAATFSCFFSPLLLLKLRLQLQLKYLIFWS
jgi:hypothetical protein